MHSYDPKGVLRQSCRDAEGTKEYFRFRAPSALSKSKQLEAEIDAEIKRVEQLLSEKEKARQTSLFGAFDEDLLNRSSND